MLPHGSGGVAVSGRTMSALSREEGIKDVMVISSEESSSYPDELELGLGLGLGSAKARIKPPPAAGGAVSWDQCARILTAKDFHAKASSSSSSSSSSVTKANVKSGSSGNKRAAESPSSPPGRSAISQVVGWPPVRAYRMNSLTNQSKSPVTEDFFSTVDKSQTKNTVVHNTKHGGSNNDANAEDKGVRKTSLFVKVNMDGIPIGRKVDLNAHRCYETLALSLDDMFQPSEAVGARRLNMEDRPVSGIRRPLQLLAGSSDFVLTYEDKEGDWMLVGDVPWEMFLNSVRRLRIMRAADANGLAPGSNEKSRKQST